VNLRRNRWELYSADFETTVCGDLIIIIYCFSSFQIYSSPIREALYVFTTDFLTVGVQMRAPLIEKLTAGHYPGPLQCSDRHPQRAQMSDGFGSYL
jgi:hypothetical protein